MKSSAKQNLIYWNYAVVSFKESVSMNAYSDHVVKLRVLQVKCITFFIIPI